MLTKDQYLTLANMEKPAIWALQSAIIELVKQNEELAKDAELYQWIVSEKSNQYTQPSEKLQDLVAEAWSAILHESLPKEVIDNTIRDAMDYQNA